MSRADGTDSTEPKTRRASLCFLVALLILAPWHVLHGVRSGHWDRPPLPHGDGPDYESIAYSLSQGDGYQFAWQSKDWQQPYLEDPDHDQYTQFQRKDWPGETASRPPLLPALIAGIYQFAPRGPIAFSCVRLILACATACAGALAVTLAYRLAVRSSCDGWIPWIAAGATLALALLDRTVRTYSVDFLTEPIAMMLVTFGCCIAVHSQAGGNTRGVWLALAVIFALLVYTRSLMILWLPGWVVLVVLSTSERRIRRALGFGVLVVVLLSPWWIRNCIVLERFMPLGGQGAASLRGGYSDEALADHGNWHGEAENRIQAKLDLSFEARGWTQAQREVALAELANRETLKWINEHRPEMPQLILERIKTHWGPYRGTSLAWRIAILIGGLCLLFQRRREAIWLIGVPLISTCVVAILYETGGRFLVPLYGILYGIAGYGVSQIACFALRLGKGLDRS